MHIAIQAPPTIKQLDTLTEENGCADRDAMTDTALLLLDGCCMLATEEDSLCLTQGDIYILPAGSRYRLAQIKQGATFSLICVGFTAASTESEPPLRLCRYIPYGRYSHARHTLFADIRHGSITAPPTKAFTLLLQHAAHFSAVPIAEEQYSTLPHAIQRAMTYVQQHTDKPLSTTHVATHCNLSPQHIIRLFRRYTGMTPLAYIIRKKMQLANTLLAQKEMTVTKIAEAIGYLEPAYFSRLYTQFEGCPPSEVRSKMYPLSE